MLILLVGWWLEAYYLMCVFVSIPWALLWDWMKIMVSKTLVKHLDECSDWQWIIRFILTPVTNWELSVRSAAPGLKLLFHSYLFLRKEHPRYFTCQLRNLVSESCMKGPAGLCWRAPCSYRELCSWEIFRIDGRGNVNTCLLWLPQIGLSVQIT